MASHRDYDRSIVSTHRSLVHWSTRKRVNVDIQRSVVASFTTRRGVYPEVLLSMSSAQSQHLLVLRVGRDLGAWLTRRMERASSSAQRYHTPDPDPSNDSHRIDSFTLTVEGPIRPSARLSSATSPRFQSGSHLFYGFWSFVAFRKIGTLSLGPRRSPCVADPAS